MEVKNSIKKIFDNKSKRSKIIIENILLSVIIKGLSLASSIILIPITLSLLDSTKYGIWITLYSIVNWFNMMDIGLGNGYRNRFAEAIAKGNTEKAQKLTETLYSSTIIISISFIIIYTTVHQFINWKAILNTPLDFDENISYIVYWVFVIFAMILVLKNLNTILLALQKTALNNLVIMVGNILSMIIIIMIGLKGIANLQNIAISYMTSQAFTLIIFSVYLFRKKLYIYIPKKINIVKEYFDEILNLGLKFFFIQITTIILFSSGNILIIQLYSPEHVVPYNIANKLYTSLMFLFTIIITPFWSAYTEAIAKKDYVWIQSSLSTLKKIWIIFIVFVVVITIISENIYSLWIGNLAYIPFDLTLAFGLHVILLSWNSINSQFLNGVGKIQIQLIISFVQTIINIPIAIILSIYLRWEITGIIMATNISLVLSAVVLHIQVNKISNNKAYSIWNK